MQFGNGPFYSISAILSDSNGFSWKILVTSSGFFSGSESFFVNPTKTITFKMIITLGSVPYDLFFDEYYIPTTYGSSTIDIK